MFTATQKSVGWLSPGASPEKMAAALDSVLRSARTAIQTRFVFARKKQIHKASNAHREFDEKTGRNKSIIVVLEGCSAASKENRRVRRR